MPKPAAIVDAPVGTTATTSATADAPARRGSSTRKAPGIVTWVDDRAGVAGLLKKNLRKVFPDHWSFLLGEIALFSFIVLLLTGVFLTIWFKPSMAETEYDGAYQLLKGVPMSEAYASAVQLSFDVRGGLLIRQMHHWAAMLFVGAAVVHMLRVFFTGAFRKPREINWLIGVGLFSMAMVEGFAGYSLPDDLLSGTGLRFVDGLIRSIPLVGTWAEFFIFGGEFPGTAIVPRLYMVHILLIPGLLLALIGAHMALLVYHKHTQYPGPGRREDNVVGYPMFPVYAAKAGGFFFIVFAFIALMGAMMTINPVWTYGPYNPSQVTAGSQPDWYMGFAEGAVRLMPGWESHLGPTTWSWNVFIPGVGGMTLLFTLIAIWPFVERWLTGDDREHHLLDLPHNAPTRTAIGVAAMTAYGVLWAAAGNDLIATQFHTSLNAITWVLRVGLFVLPVIAFWVTRRLCLSLQRRDKERALHGSESGVIMRAADGGYSEDHLPVSVEEQWTLTQHGEHHALEASPTVDERGNAIRTRPVSARRAAWSRWFNRGYVQPASAADLDHGDHHGLDAGEDRPQLH